MKYIECNTMLEAESILLQVRNEGNNNWADMHCCAETGKVFLTIPGCDLEKFNKPCCDKLVVDEMRCPKTAEHPIV